MNPLCLFCSQSKSNPILLPSATQTCFSTEEFLALWYSDLIYPPFQIITCYVNSAGNINCARSFTMEITFIVYVIRVYLQIQEMFLFLCLLHQ
jgi:hypothetical protein